MRISYLERRCQPKSAKGEQCLTLFFAHRHIAFGDGQQSFGVPAATMTPITVLRSASTIFPSELLGRRRNIGHEFARLILDIIDVMNTNDVGGSSTSDRSSSLD